MQPAGVPLDVLITRKNYVTASGERHDVLRDIAFKLGAGEVAAFVGPSGCGKTTILRLIAGLDPDFDGAIARPPGTLGMVFQEPRLLPWRTVEQNIRLVAPYCADATLAALFDVLGLAQHRAHFPGELSLGLARRVALARAFAVEPSLLILDEPFASLDGPLAARLRDELSLLVGRRPVMTLLVTHDIDEAVRLADRLFLLSARPARILADVTIPGSRSARNEADIAALKADISQRLREAR
ncbi:MAG: NitT/TauT family transport system ATP-binding protein [Hyphomicrobiales bacterium]